MRRLAILGLLIVAGCTVTACVFPYYMQAVGGQVSLLRQRVPIEQVIDDADYDSATRAELELVLGIRAFAVSELGLPDNESYTSYVDLGRDYVVYNVIAAEEFSIEPLTWCFPVAGCVSYRGYFKRENAEKFAARLADRGHDVFTGGSPAYSTLGHFADPVLNTMLGRGETTIAATLFHELAHQRLYIKDDTELSESFATAVERYAVEQWLNFREQPEALADYRARLDRERQFAALVGLQRERLRQIFASDANDQTKRDEKSAAFDWMRGEYESLKSAWGGNGAYDFWFSNGLNNAKLVAVTSYQRWVPGLSARLRALGPEAFFAELETLVELESDERVATLERWNSGSALAALANDR